MRRAESADETPLPRSFLVRIASSPGRRSISVESLSQSSDMLGLRHDRPDDLQRRVDEDLSGRLVTPAIVTAGPRELEVIGEPMTAA